jgi:glycosyltransferase involved in cell wall biosynthesis
VVVPTRERSAYVGDLLAALQQSTMPRFEVLLMDQTQGNSTERVVRAMHDERFKYHRMTRPGANPARNLGAALAAAPIVAFTDDDCAPPPEWLQRIVDAFDDPELEFAFGALVAPPYDGRAGSVPSFAPNPRLQVKRNRRKVMTSAAGASMVCRKSFLRKYGAFDELLGPDRPLVRNDDTTICYKVIRSAAKWEMRPDIATVHQHGYRPWPQIWDIYRGEMFGSGVNYARFVRRGDAYAAWLFLLELRDMSVRPLRALVKLRRPDGAGYLLEYVRGFIAGLRLDGRVGYVDGAEIERMERTGLLDPPDAAGV